MDFEAFPKIGRLSRNCTITEKIDGTNAQVCIAPALTTSITTADRVPASAHCVLGTFRSAVGEEFLVYAGSRTRWITPEDDNFGFAGWVKRNLEELSKLGPGRHFGEWWGSGIQRKYGLTGPDKRFSLFNVHRWSDKWGKGNRPACCGVVPTLYEGIFTQDAVDIALAELQGTGSYAVEGFMQPEGIVIYHHGVKQYFKKTLEKDEEPKGQRVV